MSGHRAAHDLLVSPFASVDPGDGGVIGIDRYGQIVELESEAAETRKLADPFAAGVRATIRMAVDGGDIVLTADNGLNVAGNTTATFADVGDQIDLISVSAASGYRWEILTNTGAVALA